MTTNLSQLKELLGKATPGKWVTGKFLDKCRPQLEISSYEHMFWLAGVGSPNESPEVAQANANLIVAAVNALPDLLREREALREALTALLGRLESGDLVRNTKWDGEADWAIKQIPLLRDLAKAHEVLAGGGGE